MSAVSDIKSQLDLAQVAQLLGTDEATAGQAVDQALESLVGTMDANVGDPDQALGLTRALGDHVDAASEVDLAQVDTADGEKIVGHVFSTDQIQALSQGAGGSLIRKLLPILAPIVMGYLASKLDAYMRGQTGGAAAQAPTAPAQQPSGGLGDILGGMLGGGPGSAGGGLGVILGSILGGAAAGGAAGGAASGGLGDILGGILGDQGGAAEPAPRQQAPQPQAPAGADGPFRAPTTGGTTLDAGTPTAPQQQTQQAPGGVDAGGVLGGILSDLLRGRR